MTPSAPSLRHADPLGFIAQVVENLPDMVFVKDAGSLRFVLFNRAGEDLIGQKRDALLGKNDYDLFPKDQADFFTQKDREVLASGTPLDIPEEPIETPRGRRWLHTKKVPLLAEDGTPQYLLGISEDITERRRVERMKDDLLSVASHELRSPTAAMVGTLQLLEARLGDQLDARSRETLELAKENGRRMIELLETCLDAERVEQDSAALDLVHLDLGEVAADAVRLNQPFADRYSVRYVLIEAAPDAIVEGDRARLMQVLTNVMTNAAKFSPEGSTVEVAVVAEGDAYRVTVRDQGPGIPASFQARVFDKFSRARSRESAAREGAGLGMRIAQELIERMGGEIGFESTVGEGTTFWVALRALQAPR